MMNLIGDIEKIIIHCSASKGADAETIRQDHVKSRGFDDIGYHFVILNGRCDWAGRTWENDKDGLLETGRDLKYQGAHAKGHNHGSIGVCVIGTGEGRFTPRQILTLIRLISKLRLAYDIPNDRIHGHKDFDQYRECPGFNVQDFIEQLG